ncbi:hypothetical protein GCM10010289_62920 [Streptomyces violascens]|nr:DUF3592 domain-containing protein [Streptomyces violascens]GGU33094.1 hypothetical protein GCM10010289_62920 [Streptomyces violascens]
MASAVFSHQRQLSQRLHRLVTAQNGIDQLEQPIGRLRTITNGIAVEGRCVRRYSSQGSEGNTYWHHVHGFTTLEGQYLVFEEDAMLLAQGDTVTVRYRPDNPARTAPSWGAGEAGHRCSAASSAS